MLYQMDNPLVFGYPIVTLWGARVRVSPFYLIVLLWLVGPLGWKVGTLAFLVLSFSILIHEYSHVFAARATGGEAEEVILWPFGGLALCQRAPTFQSEFMTPAAGPLSNFALAMLMLPGVIQSDQFSQAIHPLWFPRVDLEKGIAASTILLTFTLNWKLFLLNLVPMLPLDGSSMWHAIARTHWEPVIARTAMLIGSTASHVALTFVAMNIDSTIGIGVLFLAYLLLPITIVEWIRLQASHLSGLEAEESGEYERFDEDEGQERTSRQNRRPGLLERWRMERDRKRQEREVQERLAAQARLDLLLEKVHSQGIDSLTSSEKRFLDQESARYRGQSRPS